MRICLLLTLFVVLYSQVILVIKGTMASLSIFQGIDFQYGYPAYFDLSVSSTTQLSYVCSASCADVTAAAGMLAMDEKHLRWKQGDFIPILASVWRPFA